MLERTASTQSGQESEPAMTTQPSDKPKQAAGPRCDYCGQPWSVELDGHFSVSCHKPECMTFMRREPALTGEGMAKRSEQPMKVELSHKEYNYIETALIYRAIMLREDAKNNVGTRKLYRFNVKTRNRLRKLREEHEFFAEQGRVRGALWWQP